MKKLSDTAKSIIAILNNINELITVSSDRANAKDVMSALKTYANTKKFPIPNDKIDSFLNVLIDSHPTTLTSILRDIAIDITKADAKSKKFK